MMVVIFNQLHKLKQIKPTNNPYPIQNGFRTVKRLFKANNHPAVVLNPLQSPKQVQFS